MYKIKILILYIEFFAAERALIAIMPFAGTNLQQAVFDSVHESVHFINAAAPKTAQVFL